MPANPAPTITTSRSRSSVMSIPLSAPDRTRPPGYVRPRWPSYFIGVGRPEVRHVLVGRPPLPPPPGPPALHQGDARLRLAVLRGHTRVPDGQGPGADRPARAASSPRRRRRGAAAGSRRFERWLRDRRDQLAILQAPDLDDRVRTLPSGTSPSGWGRGTAASVRSPRATRCSRPPASRLDPVGLPRRPLRLLDARPGRSPLVGAEAPVPGPPAPRPDRALRRCPAAPGHRQAGPPTRRRSRRSTRRCRPVRCSCSSTRTCSAWRTRPCSGASATSSASTTWKVTAPPARTRGSRPSCRLSSAGGPSPRSADLPVRPRPLRSPPGPVARAPGRGRRFRLKVSPRGGRRRARRSRRGGPGPRRGCRTRRDRPRWSYSSLLARPVPDVRANCPAARSGCPPARS